MSLTVTKCRYRGCTAPLDPSSKATYCRPAHRVAEHRAVVAGARALDAARRAEAVQLLDVAALEALDRGDHAAASEAVRMASEILERSLR
ncbi:hypothetical protein V6K52_10055 [Knoellia sp. S7-12]|uniref:hypothetical protein n=1 Tax=Knoellia sp. S7-12 TaxID=3126698 RepID=UPI0033695FB6